MFGGHAERKFLTLQTGTSEKIGPGTYIICDTGENACKINKSK